MYSPAQLGDRLSVLLPGFGDIVFTLTAMLQRAFLCLTAFLAASTAIVGENRVLGGVDAQYLLGLGE